mmetsp:Transcript_10239/g.28212  ORF Transcript_10239/g.28212 Transcript_10239/m.28212 type:complete len:449 (+) Transcript_10239:75-1421(+)
MEPLKSESGDPIEAVTSWFSSSPVPIIPQKESLSESDDAWVDFFLMDKMDNLSFLCDRYSNHNEEQCADCPVAFAKILRWSKLIILRVARSYYAHSVVLVVLPVLVGLAIGYMLGKKTSSWDRQQQVWLMKLKENCSASLVFVASYFPLYLLGPTTPTIQKTEPNTSDASDSKTEVDVTSKPVRRDSSGGLPSHNVVKHDLRSDRDTRCESGVDEESLPRHLAIIMDGNRRYGKAHHGSKTAGHEAGGRKVMEFAKWCIAEKIKTITLFAFSTENWKRDPAEVAALMSIFLRHCEEILEEARPRNICVRFLSTQPAPLPANVRDYITKIESDTRDCNGLYMNVCLSYGSRDEIVRTCRSFARECQEGKLRETDITESTFSDRLLTRGVCDPDVLIRTSGEVRISNFLLWQLAYSELFFLNKAWPAVEKDDLLEIIRSYAVGRQRRYGK